MAVSKPLPGALIDRTAPLAQNVASFWTLNEGAGTAFLDSAGNSPGAASGVVVRSQGGIVLSGSSYVALGKEYLEVNKKFSFVTRIKTTTGNQCAIAATWASGSKAGFYVLLNFSAGKLSVGMASASNAAYIQKDATKSVLDGVEHVIGFDYDASQTLAGLTIYIDGLPAAIATTYIAGTIGAFSHTGFNLGADGAGNLKYVGNIGYAGLFVGGNIGAAGHAAIAQNPWALWSDEPQLVFAPATGTTVTPDTATLTLTGYAPGVAAPADVAPGAGSLIITSYAPTVTAPASVTPDVGTLTLTGFVPSVTAPADVTPGAGSLTITSYAPTVTAPASVTPDAGAVTLTGFVPSVTAPADVVPSVVALTLIGYAPDVAFSGGVNVTPDTAALVLTGYAPSITAPAALTPDVTALVLTGYAPTVLTPVTVTPDAASLTVTGYAPTITAPATVVPDTGALTLTGYAPTVTTDGNVSVTPDCAVLTLTGYAPDVTGGVSGGGGYDKPKKKYLVQKGKKLLVFGSADAAMAELDKPEEVISLPAVKAYAKVQGKIDAYNAAYRAKEYADLLAMFERMRLDEDMEALLML